MAELDVVLVNYRTPHFLFAAVESIDHFMPPLLDYEIFTVDTSPDEEAVGKFVIPNKGYGQAVNFGVALGSAPNVLILNADVAMRADSNIENCLGLLQDPKVAAVGPKQVNPTGWIASAGCPPANNGVGYEIRGWRQADRGQFVEPVLDCKYVAGSIVFTRRETFEELGGFLETPLYYEEAFYCWKARHRGYRIVYTGTSVWTHHWDSSPKDDQHLLSGRPIARRSYDMFVAACQGEGITDIPPFI